MERDGSTKKTFTIREATTVKEALEQGTALNGGLVVPNCGQFVARETSNTNSWIYNIYVYMNTYMCMYFSCSWALVSPPLPDSISNRVWDFLAPPNIIR